jgi:hypothetical protein
MKYTYWTREIAGWVVLLIGLGLFWATYQKLSDKRIFEAGPMAFMGFIVFRGGVHLLKVAVAAQAARSLPESSALPATRKASRMPTRSIAPTPVKSVVPGPKSRAAAAASSNGMPD